MKNIYEVRWTTEETEKRRKDFWNFVDVKTERKSLKRAIGKMRKLCEECEGDFCVDLVIRNKKSRNLVKFFSHVEEEFRYGFTDLEIENYLKGEVDICTAYNQIK